MSKTIQSVSRENPSIVSYLEHVQTRLKPSRFIHTLGVVDMAAKLCEAHGGQLEEVMTAAALHDYAKNHHGADLILLAQEFDLDLDPILMSSSELLHGMVGAELVKRELNILNEAILNAIRFHTFGRVGMGLTEKLVYLADAIEDSRKYPGVEKLRKLAVKDLDRAIFDSVGLTIVYVVEQGFVLHPNSVKLYNELAVEFMTE